MKKTIPVLVLLIALAACGKHENRAEVTVEQSNGSAVATLAGPNVKTVVAGETVEIRGGEVFIGDRSFGAVPEGAVVVYKVDAEGKELLVNGETRFLLR
ncbi:MAG TPA: hypothetical protein VN248_00710 [Arenimonas sp.]|nr:hypothetical protein [Arenimonas sp.]